MASYCVMVLGYVVVSLGGYFTGLLATLLLVSIASVAVRAPRWDALAALGVGALRLVGLRSCTRGSPRV